MMLLSDLPREIIHQFTELLSLKDKISCSLVCKSWKEIFQDSLHSDLVIDRYSLHKIVNPTQDNQPSCLKTRFLVRYLELNYYTNATDEELYILQQTFPNIKYLYSNGYSISSVNFGATADWNIWRSLTELCIPFNHIHAPDINDKIIKIILCLPLLRRLQIIADDKSNIQSSFSLNDYETIHSHLNHLGYLELCGLLSTLSETDIERMTKVSPAIKMRSLEITSGNIERGWLCYFTRKYPNLCALGLSIKQIQPKVDEKRSDTISLFQQTHLPFQHLTKLNIRYSNLAKNSYLVFWDILHFHNMPLKHLSLYVHAPDNITSPIDIRDIPKRITEVCLSKFSKTIESFRLECPDTLMNRCSFEDINCTLYNLVHLDMSTSTTCEIDTLLCVAPHLRSIKFEYGNIKLKGELYDSNRFGLQSFNISCTKLTSDVLRFLSFHCRSLNELVLYRSSVYGNFTTPGRQFIDMTYTRLKRFYMDATSFIIQDYEKRKEDNYTVLLTKPVDDIPPKQDYNSNVLPVVGDPPVKFYFELFCTDKYDDMWILAAEESSTYEEFVSDHEESKIIIKRTTDRGYIMDRSDDSFPYESYYNYTKIEFGYISDFEIIYSYEG